MTLPAGLTGNVCALVFSLAIALPLGFGAGTAQAAMNSARPTRPVLCTTASSTLLGCGSTRRPSGIETSRESPPSWLSPLPNSGWLKYMPAWRSTSKSSAR